MAYPVAQNGGTQIAGVANAGPASSLNNTMTGAATTPGWLLVACATGSATTVAGGLTNVSDTRGNFWRQARIDATSDGWCAIWYCISRGTTTTDVLTYTYGSSNTEMTGRILAFSGVAPVVDNPGGASSTATGTAIATTMTLATTDTLAISLTRFASATATITLGGGWSGGVQTTTAHRAEIAYSVRTAAGTLTTADTCSANNTQREQSIVAFWADRNQLVDVVPMLRQHAGAR